MAGRRDRIADITAASGLMGALERMPRVPQLLVINYHRIGDNSATEFDPEVFSASQEGFADQVAHIKKHYGLLHPGEARDIIAGRTRLRHMCVLLTFDDGYLDNLTLAVPVLKAHDASAAFFLITGQLDEPSRIQWWDRIAWQVRRCVGKTIALSQPEPGTIPVTAENLERSIAAVLARFRSAGIDEALFFAELDAAAGVSGDAARSSEPLMMSWDDARAMRDAGMTIGLHTDTHTILSRLDEAGQRREIVTCRGKLKDKLGIDADMLAYPVGTHAAFSPVTKDVARACGLTAAFSFYGGSNKPGAIDPFDVRRVAFPSYASEARGRAALTSMALSGSRWF